MVPTLKLGWEKRLRKRTRQATLIYTVQNGNLQLNYFWSCHIGQDWDMWALLNAKKPGKQSGWTFRLWDSRSQRDSVIKRRLRGWNLQGLEPAAGRLPDLDLHLLDPSSACCAGGSRPGSSVLSCRLPGPIAGPHLPFGCLSLCGPRELCSHAEFP